uniref:FANCG protein n=1 Tax=Apteryx owenii TaxID=8824 RepID=A0A8B9QAK6_APTOW
ELLSLLKAWRVPAEGDSVSLVQSAEDLKEILCTAAAFLQGLQELEAGNLPAALSLLQEAAGGFCSKRVLAQIYTCLSCCARQMGKPQTALQHLKRALQVDFQCLPALSHAAAVYHELGETDAELQALAVLYEVCLLPPVVQWGGLRVALLGGSCGSPVSVGLLCLAGSCAVLCLSTAVTFPPQVPLDGGSALPRIPEVFLEAASALEQAGRHQDAITVCEEVVSRTADLIPQTLRVEEGPEQLECPSAGTELAGGPLSQKRESLCCLVWRTAAYLHQGWAWAKLGKKKEAITQFSSLLPEVKLLQEIRLLSLIGRGTQFLELGRHREALLDFQYGLQISPGKRLIFVRDREGSHKFFPGLLCYFQ